MLFSLTANSYLQYAALYIYIYAFSRCFMQSSLQRTKQLFKEL